LCRSKGLYRLWGLANPSIFQMGGGCARNARTITSVGGSNAIGATNLSPNSISMGNLNIYSKKAILWVFRKCKMRIQSKAPRVLMNKLF